MKSCPTCHLTYPDDFSVCPRDGAALTSPATETEAQLAAGLSRRFRIIRQLGKGGMGTVFLAEQIGVGNRPVALKVLNRKLLDDADFLVRFQNEAGSTGRIHHPNVVTIHESGQGDDGTPYIAMEFLEGESLREVMERRGALPVTEVAEILQQAARGLNAAHKLGIIHRDLKPDNIFLTYGYDESVAPVSPPAPAVGAPLVGALPVGTADTGRPQGPPLRPLVVKIVDFGIAKLRESATHTMTGTVLGTPAYMSYEQASGMRSDELDARSDVYSLGVVVYEMLTGRTPFHSDTPVGYLRKHLMEEPPPFRVVKPGLHALPQLESVVMKALTKDRSQRFSSAMEFALEFTRGAPTLPPAEAFAATKLMESGDKAELEQVHQVGEKTGEERYRAEKAETKRFAHSKAESERLAREQSPATRRGAERAKLTPQEPDRTKYVVLGLVGLAVITAAVWYFVLSGTTPRNRPLDQVQVFTLLGGQAQSPRVTMLVQERGINFEPTDDYLQEVRLAGGEEELVSSLKSAKVTKLANSDPSLQARQAEIQQHAARGAEFFHNERYTDAEAEYRAAVQLDPQNSDLHVALSRALTNEGKPEDGLRDAREAVRLDPHNDMAHFALGSSLAGKGDLDGAIAESRAALSLDPDNDMAQGNLGEQIMVKGDIDAAIVEDRKALRLNPKNAITHVNLGVALSHKADSDGAIGEFREGVRLSPKYDKAHVALGNELAGKGDLDGAIAEYHEALGSKPKNDNAHFCLGVALGKEGDWSGDIAEQREALRLNPKNEGAHVELGEALRNKGDWNGDIAEQREALRLDPDNEMAHIELGVGLANKGDWDGAISGYREALRREPKNDDVHALLGLALVGKGDTDGAIAEEREALRLNPKNADTHHDLGSALEQARNLEEALKEYRAAYLLNPKKSDYQQDYERLLKQQGK